MKRDIKLNFKGEDEWGRFIYVDNELKLILKMVDDVLHTTSSQGEPVAPISDKKCNVIYLDDLPNFIRFSRDYSTITVEYKGVEETICFDKHDSLFVDNITGTFNIGWQPFEVHTGRRKDELLFSIAEKLGKDTDNCYESVIVIERPVVVEYCAECEGEVTISNHLNAQNCPVCKSPIRPCAERYNHPDSQYSCGGDCDKCVNS